MLECGNRFKVIFDRSADGEIRFGQSGKENEMVEFGSYIVIARTNSGQFFADCVESEFPRKAFREKYCLDDFTICCTVPVPEVLISDELKLLTESSRDTLLAAYIKGWLDAFKHFVKVFFNE